MSVAFNWSDDLTSGVSLIDNQHQDLIKRINQFIAACETDDLSATVGLLMRFLAIYVDEHFASEERLMESSRYPDQERHLAQHAYFRQEMAAIQADLAATGPSAAIAGRARKLLVDWFRNHITQTDLALARHLRQGKDLNKQA
jgi:hemerythrin